MKRLLFLSCLFALFGCSRAVITQDEPVKIVSSRDFFDLRPVARGVFFDIYVEKNTGVLYALGNNGRFTPIMEADGTCLTFEKWKSKRWDEQYDTSSDIFKH